MLPPPFSLTRNAEMATPPHPPMKLPHRFLKRQAVFMLDPPSPHALERWGRTGVLQRSDSCRRKCRSRHVQTLTLTPIMTLTRRRGRRPTFTPAPSNHHSSLFSLMILAVPHPCHCQFSPRRSGRRRRRNDALSRTPRVSISRQVGISTNLPSQ